MREASVTETRTMRVERLLEDLTQYLLPTYGYGEYGFHDEAGEAILEGISTAVREGVRDLTIYRIATEAALTASVDFAHADDRSDYIEGRVRRHLIDAAYPGAGAPRSTVLADHWPETASKAGLDKPSA